MASEISDEAGARKMRSRMATVVAINAVGYSRLMSDDAGATVTDLEAARAIAAAHAEAHGARIADFAGDAVIAVFDTSLGAVFAAVAIQADMTVRAEASPENRRVLLRVGVHSGDILEQEDGSVYGDAVNIAAWLESLAPSGGVTVSKEVQKLAGAQSELRFVDQGDYDVKNISRPIRGLSRGAGRRVEQSRPVGKRRRITMGNLPALPVDLVGRVEAIRGVARCSASCASSRCSAWAAWAKPACLLNRRAARRLTFPTAPGSPTLPW
jgi:class 3 adenylate cyclase